MPKLIQLKPVLMSRDVERSIAFYLKLGFKEIFRDQPDDPKYAGVARDGVEIHIQWNDPAEWLPGADRPNYRFVVDDVDALFEQFKSAGVLSPNSKLMDTPWGTREFHVHDPDRNGLQFYRGL